MGKPSPFKEIDGVMYRKCIKCQEYKIFDEFYKDKNRTFGVGNKCKICFEEYREKYYKQNKEHYRGYKKKYYEQNKEKEREYREQNKERINKRIKEYNNNIKNKYGVSQTTLRYREDENFRLNFKLRSSNRQNLKRALEYYNNGKSDKLPIKSPSRMLLKLYEIQNHNCPYCSNNMKDDIHIDHIIPLSKNGSNEVHNLILCCSNCNLRKSAKELDVWLSECNINYDEFILDIERRNEMYFSE